MNPVVAIGEMTLSHVVKKLFVDDDVVTYHTKEFGRRTGPKPVQSPFGPEYRMHPELSRSTFGIAASTFALPLAFVGTPILLAGINYAVIETDVPSEQRPGYWQMYSSALTGTFGGGFTGIV